MHQSRTEHLSQNTEDWITTLDKRHILWCNNSPTNERPHCSHGGT